MFNPAKLEEFKKHSSIVQISNKITADQRKCFNVLLHLAREILLENPDIKTRIFQIDVAKIKKMAGVSATNNKQIKKTLEEIVDITVKYNLLDKDKKEEWGVFSLLAQALIKKGSGVLSFAFPPIIYDTLLRPQMYTLLDLKVLRGLYSKHSIALYELLKDYIGVNKTGKIGIKKFKELMGIEKVYRDFANIRRWVLEPAIKEINAKTDIFASYKEIREGIKIASLQFFMKIKSVKKPKSITVKAKNIQPEKKQISNNIEPELYDYIFFDLKKDKSKRDPKAIIRCLNENEIRYYKKEFELKNNKKFSKFEGRSDKEFKTWVGDLEYILSEEVKKYIEKLSYHYSNKDTTYLVGLKSMSKKSKELVESELKKLGQKVHVLS